MLILNSVVNYQTVKKDFLTSVISCSILLLFHPSSFAINSAHIFKAVSPGKPIVPIAVLLKMTSDNVNAISCRTACITCALIIGNFLLIFLPNSGEFFK